jgi:hypothetical protein
MLSCSDYEGSYTVGTTSCSSGCVIPASSTLEVVCSPSMELLVDTASHAASVNSEGQLVVASLGLVASVTGSAPNRFLFGVAEGGSSLSNGDVEVWGADEG